MIPEATRIAAVRRQRNVLRERLGSLVCFLLLDQTSQFVEAFDIVTTDFAVTS